MFTSFSSRKLLTWETETWKHLWTIILHVGTLVRENAGRAGIGLFHKKKRVGLVRVELGNVNIKLMHFLLPAFFYAGKSAD